MVIALAPELDLKYERVYGYLQDDVTRKRPTVDLALNLLCASFESKLAHRAYISFDAPLVRQQLLHVFADPNQPRPPLLSHYMELDEQVVRLLLDERCLDARLAPFCSIVEPNPGIQAHWLAPGIQPALVATVRQASGAAPC